MLLYEEFFRELSFKQSYSAHTLMAYKRDMMHYKDFCKTGQSIQDFYFFLTQKKLSPSSQARIISCVRTYLKFLQNHGHPTIDIKRLKPPKIIQKLPKFINLTEFKSLWKACEVSIQSSSLRNKLVLAFLYGLGCRVSELIALNLQDFNETEAWISVTGKGNKQRLLPLPASIYNLLIVYLKKARPSIRKKESHSLLFNNKGNRPSRVDIWRWLKTWSLKAGFNDVKNPHSFRHGCATGLLESGANLRTIQQLLGHISIQTTQIYTSVNPDKLKKAISQHHPLSKI